MLALILFSLQFTILLFLSRSFAKHFYRFWFLLTKSNTWAIRLTSFFLFPGTLLHELSHWLVAELCMVPTGKITLTPQLEEGKGIKLGSVALARTDPFRRTLIGIAPFIVGLGIISLIVTKLPNSWDEYFGANNYSPLHFALYVLLFTLIFLISNTMFSSPKDLDSAFVPTFLIILLSIAWWWFGWPVPEPFIRSFDLMIQKLNLVFVITIGINGLFLLLVKLLTKVFGKLLNRRLVNK